MPIKVAPDPNNPGGFIWVDSNTGEPAVQPGGPGTAYVAPSELTPDQQRQITAPQRKATNDALIAAYEEAHGKRISEPSVTDAYIDNPSAAPGDPKKIPNPNPTQHYTFADGYSVDVSSNGEVIKQTPGPKVDTTAASANRVGTPETGVWEKQNGTWVQVVSPQAGVTKPSNPDEDRLKAINTQVAEAQRNERQANEAAGKGYLTDAEAATIQQGGTRLNQSQQSIDLDKAKFAQQQKEFDQKQALDVAKTTADVAQSGATTTEIQARTQATQQAVDIAGQKLPGELAQQGATLQQTQAQTQAQLANAAGTAATTQRTQQQIQQGNAPTVENIAATSPYIYQRDPNTGALTPQLNQGYVPKTAGEVAARVGQMQAAAQAQRDQISQQLQAGVYGSGADAQQKAAAAFDQWWGQNVEPQKAALQVAQDQANAEQQRLAQEQNRANYATALTAGSNAIEAQKALLPYMVGPGWSGAVNQIAGAYSSGKMPGNIDIGAATSFQLPDMQALSNAAVNTALAHISPTAQSGLAQGPSASGLQAPPAGQQPGMAGAAAGMGSQDISSQLQRTTYSPTITITPDGTTHINTGGGPTQSAAPPGPTPQQLANQNAAGGQVTNLGAFSGANPATGPATNQPATYGVLSGQMPSLMAAAQAPYQAPAF